MNNHFDVVVIGGGSAGMVSAITAAERKKDVLLLEKSEKVGRKILASGNGRCNLMNTGTPRYFGDPSFAGNVLRYCPYQDITRFFHYYGLVLSEENDGRVYPASFQSASVVSVLKTAMKISGVHVLTGSHVIHTTSDGRQFHIMTEKGTAYTSDKLIIACGGAAQNKIGGTYDGYKMLQSFGHTIITPMPALVPLETDKKSISGLSGTRIKCHVSLYGGRVLLCDEKGELLFTDYGVSGICIMQCGRFVDGKNNYLLLNLLENAFDNETSALTELSRRKTIFRDCSPVCLLEGILPSKLSYAVLKQAGIPLRGETADKLTDADIRNIVRTAFHYHISITGTRGFDFAQVTSGGADCSEFDPSSMSSHITQGLHAAGEVLNVDGDCGGFNLMFAFSSGILAGKAV